MADQSDTSSVADAPTGSLMWRIRVATLAHRFFAVVHDSGAAQLIDRPADAGRTDSAWSVAHFIMYLQKLGFKATPLQVLSEILCGMERAGLIMRAGWYADLANAPMVGQLYISQGVGSTQINGNMWLSGVFGAELIIESYNWVTLLIGGGEGKPVGTGLVLDRSHMVTNRHVIEGLVGPGPTTDTAGPGPTGAPIEVIPSFTLPGAEPVARRCRITGHASLDVAVIEVDIPENAPGLLALPGMSFRDPKWHDEVCVFGYPYVPGLTERPITIERGEVVNPATEAAAWGGYPRQKTFLTSAVARPGNSGGPIVAQDGRVIGLVVEDARDGLPRAAAAGAEAEVTGEPQSIGAPSPPFYRGIPGSEVVRAIQELSPHFGGRLDGLAIIENPG